VGEVLGDGIAEGALELGPHELIGVEFRCITREALHVEAWVGGTELPNRTGLVNRGAIPQQDNGTSEVSEQVLEEPAHGQGRDVRGLEVKAQA
jgi:hypothetical protein